MNDIRLRQIILCILMLSLISPARGQSSAGSNIVSRTVLSAHKGSVPLCLSLQLKPSSKMMKVNFNFSDAEIFINLSLNIFIMKKILLVIIAIVLSINLNAQDFKHYRLDEVNGDTVQYLQKNFIGQKAYFIGKPFSKVMEVYLQDLPLNYSAKNTTTPWENPRDRTKYINGISITWFTVEEARFYVYNHIKKKLFLFILFAPPYNEVGSDVAEKYDTDEKMVNHLKNYIVKDIKL